MVILIQEDDLLPRVLGRVGASHRLDGWHATRRQIDETVNTLNNILPETNYAVAKSLGNKKIIEVHVDYTNYPIASATITEVE